MNVSLKPAQPTHLAELIPLVLEFNAIENIKTTRERVQSSLGKLLADPSLGLVPMIFVDQALAGYAIVTYGYDIEYGGRDAWITDLYVRPDFQGKGVGAKAIEELEKLARNNAVCALHLMVYDSNERAKKLYAKRGFERHRRIAMMKSL